LGFRRAEAEAGEHAGDILGRRRLVDIDGEPADRLRFLGGDLLDIHAAFGGE
jgi:hypothetical protein